jgi:hypothetical protein
MLTAIRGGGWIGIAVGVLNKILNPLKEVQEKVDRLLNQGNDLVTNAEQFNTTAGKLFKLQTFAKANLLEPDQLFDMMRKFQSAVAQAEADPKKASAVRAYVGQKDIGDAFFEFIQSLNTLDRNAQVKVQEEVFGGKATLRMADFLRSDFKKLEKDLRLGPADLYTGDFQRLAGLSVVDNINKARVEAEGDIIQSRLIGGNVISARDRQRQRDVDQDVKRIQSYDSINNLNEKFDRLLKLAEDGLTALGTLVGRIESATSGFKLPRVMRNAIQDYKPEWETK